MAAANRALKGYNDTLADQCLFYAKKLWNEDDNLNKKDTSRFASRFRRNMEMSAALQLFITTKDEHFAQRFKDAIWPILDRSVMSGMTAALQAYPYMDKDYQNKLRNYVNRYKKMSDDFNSQNPYRVPLVGGGWGGNGSIINWAITNYYAYKIFSDIISPEYVYKGLNYIFGCHPYSNISFVSSVGTRSKKITYGNNRADFSFIAGGVVPGLLLLKPDFPENKED